ncbi:malate and lactate dehydrogenase [Holotrichia oblita]|uniref:Malate and lactate dehydrogenase n=1 Tax=Holotrichia oblita TaxID=644536 RepID=A0ACB9SRF2_HOLOL|nr:malate and lactate dehydrogenase [Holotrichia oblita]
MLNRALLNIFRRGCSTDPNAIKKDAFIRKKVAIDKFKQKAVRVAILGACSPTGEVLALLLKSNPLISHLFLHGDASRGVAADLAYIDTRTMVTGYYENDTDKAVRRAEIIVILAESKHGDAVSPPEEKFRHEYERLIKLTRMCTMYAPKAVLYICVPPISMSVPLVSSIFRKTHWYHPGRIIGSVGFHQVRLNSLVAFHNDLDPSGVHVPLIGGPDIDTLVPLFSRATPVGLGPYEAQCLMKRFRNLADCDDVMKEKKAIEFYDLSPLSHAHALNRSITTIALGLLGDQQADTCGFIRSNVIRTCKGLLYLSNDIVPNRYITTTIRIGQSGVFHNYGIPLLTPMELQLLERSVLVLDEREQQALKMLESVDERKVAVRLNSLVAFHNDLDPSGVHVPLIGGPDIDTFVPLFSRATPVGLGPYKAQCLMRRFRNLADCDDVMKEKKAMEFYDLSPISHAHALNRSITTIALGLLGDQQADTCGFIRSNVIRTCKGLLYLSNDIVPNRYITTTIRIGQSGVFHNYGIPLLTPMELQLLERSVLVLDEREQQSLKMLESVDERKVAVKSN